MVYYFVLHTNIICLWIMSKKLRGVVPEEIVKDQVSEVTEDQSIDAMTQDIMRKHGFAGFLYVLGGGILYMLLTTASTITNIGLVSGGSGYLVLFLLSTALSMVVLAIISTQVIVRNLELTAQEEGRRPRWLRFLGMGFLGQAVISSIAIVFAILPVLGVGAIAPGPGSIIIFFLAYLVFAAAIFIVSIRLSLVPYIAVHNYNKLGPFEILARSWYLAGKYSGKVVMSMLKLAALYIVGALVVKFAGPSMAYVEGPVAWLGVIVLLLAVVAYIVYGVALLSALYVKCQRSDGWSGNYKNGAKNTLKVAGIFGALVTVVGLAALLFAGPMWPLMLMGGGLGNGDLGVDEDFSGDLIPIEYTESDVREYVNEDYDLDIEPTEDGLLEGIKE